MPYPPRQINLNRRVVLRATPRRFRSGSARLMHFIQAHQRSLRLQLL
jgi:hypothetical protein